MPNPLSKVHPNPTVTLSSDALAKKPDLGLLVVTIFGRWDWIEQGTSMLLRDILGADAVPAFAMFEALEAERVRKQVLEAAASAVLVGEPLMAFNAIMSVVETAAKHRHKLAHGIWGECPEIPDALLVADPKILRLRETEREALFSQFQKTFDERAWERMEKVMRFDHDSILVYRKKDFEHALSELWQAQEALHLFRSALHFKTLDEQMRVNGFVGQSVGAMSRQRLSTLPLFSAALARLRKGQNSTQQSPRE